MLLHLNYSCRNEDREKKWINISAHLFLTTLLKYLLFELVSVAIKIEILCLLSNSKLMPPFSLFGQANVCFESSAIVALLLERVRARRVHSFFLLFDPWELYNSRGCHIVSKPTPRSCTALQLQAQLCGHEGMSVPSSNVRAKQPSDDFSSRSIRRFLFL